MRSFLCLLAFFFSSIVYASYPESEYVQDEAIANEYIVVMKPSFTPQTFSLRAGERVLKKFKTLNGMLIETENPEALKKREGVAYVEPNYKMHILADQANATWGLDRIDSRSGLDGVYKYSGAGEGVNVYIVDTGIRGSHQEFTGRMKQGFSAISGGTDDCNGHGTHVAGTVAGTTYGIAKKASIYPVRVLDCDGSGSTSGVIEGVEWIVNNARFPAVANMSLGGSKLQSLNDAVQRAIAKGVVFVVAAGNSSDDSCKYSPASTPEAITVAASDKKDVSASFTSYGACVDVYAPGVGITSAGIANNSSTDTMSGTSMASPHTAGAVALLLEKNPSASPSSIAAQLINNATRGVITRIPASTANLLIYTSPQQGSDPTPPPSNPDEGVPVECRDAFMCATASGSLTPSTYYAQHPKEVMAVNYPRPIKIYVKGTADFDIFLYQSNDGGKNWKEVARANTSGSSESMTHQAARGLYTWMVMLKTSGTSGQYNMWYVK